MELIANQQWRYATKTFDANKKVSVENVELLKNAIRLSASSYGLQPYKILIVESTEIRKALRPHSWNQNQITDASHLFVFCHDTEVTPNDIDAYLNRTRETRHLNSKDSALAEYGDFMKMKISEKSPTEQFYWNKCQTYIAFSDLLSACAALKIDTCPMEGFEPEEYNKILGLSEQGLCAAVVAAVGYRSNEDSSQALPKVRKAESELFEIK